MRSDRSRVRYAISNGSRATAGNCKTERKVSSFHKFKLGQVVDLTGIDPLLNTRVGRFEVVRLMPSERGINQYRIRSVVDGHERMATEGELAVSP